MVSYEQKEQYDFCDLLEIVKLLRGPGGCPWDREQTHRSIRHNFVEEVYEVIEAIDNADDIGMAEELGDVLLQIALHTEMAREEQRFTIAEVTDGICRKLIARHPHVFADTAVGDTRQASDNWDAIKRREHGGLTQTEEMRRVCAALPSLMRAVKLQKRAARAGCDDTTYQQALGQVKKRMEAMEQLAAQSKEAEEAVGELLMAVVSVSRLLDVNPELALQHNCENLINRFYLLEKQKAL